jgi:cytoskeletal protein RodZ
MKPDFDPYDLTPRVIPTEEPAPPPPPKPTIRRVSMGPIFHSRITKSLALILGVILAALIGYISVDYYYAKKNAVPITSISSQSITQKQPSSSTPVTTQATPAPATTTPSQPTATPAPATTVDKVYCGVSGMPEGICAIITSIRKDGLTNNSYVTADTSKVPKGTKTEIDEKSWAQGAPEIGNFKFTVSLSGQKKSGIAYTQLINGTWKVISYTLDQ